MSKSQERKEPKVLEHIRLTPAENGGVVAEHHFTSYEHKPETNVFGENEGKELFAHLSEHLGIKHDMKSAPEAEDETGGGIPEKK